MVKQGNFIVDSITLLVLVVSSILIYEGFSEWIEIVFGAYGYMEKIVIGLIMTTILYFVTGAKNGFLKRLG